MSYFIAPRSGEKSYSNFLSTIKNGVPFDRIEPHLTNEGKSKVLAEPIIYAWGNREGTSRYWRQMEYGDTVIFYAQGRLVMSGEVYYKQHSPELALAMWPPDEKGNPWEYTFFLRNLRYISIPMKVLNRLANFSPDYIIQGFRDLAGERLRGITEHYGSVEALLNDFADDNSAEIPLSDEPVYLNIKTDIAPEVTTNPKLSLPSTAKMFHGKAKTPYKADYVKRSKNNAITGSRGEVLVLNHEKRRLAELGRGDLAKKVERVSLRDDSLGYDILSFEEDGREKPIEVKSSSSDAGQIRFYITATEYKAAASLGNYHLYYVDKLNKPRPRISIFSNPFGSYQFKTRPDTYVVEGCRDTS